VARAAAVGHSSALPLLFTCQWRIDDPSNPSGLLGAIWREPTTPFEDRRAWVPGRHPGDSSPSRSKSYTSIED
jgi:hypothetical protein